MLDIIKELRSNVGEQKALYRMQRIVKILTNDWNTYSDKQKDNVIEIIRANAEIALDYFNNPLEK